MRIIELESEVQNSQSTNSLEDKELKNKLNTLNE